ncbi:hypothetical protein [Blastococcus sp. SYSU D00820]
MISTLDMCALAGVSGPGSLVARPRYAVVRSMTPFDLTGSASAAFLAPHEGTGLPAADCTAEPFGTAPFGTAPFSTAWFGAVVPGAPRTTEFVDVPRTGDVLRNGDVQRTDNSTTLGIRSPGRPLS